MRQLRRLAQISREKLVLMTKDKDRPDAEILVSIAEGLIGGGVW